MTMDSKPRDPVKRPCGNESGVPKAEINDINNKDLEFCGE